MNDLLKIKFRFVGNKPIKKAALLNSTLCIYLNEGKSFLIAKENRSVFEFMLNSGNKKEQQKFIKLLNNNSFYEFIGSVSKIEIYSKLFANFNNSEKFKAIEKVFVHFERWSAGDVKQKKKILASFSKGLKESILRRYVESLEIKHIKSNPTPRSKPIKPVAPIKPKIK
jgi:hypothetical protein